VVAAATTATEPVSPVRHGRGNAKRLRRITLVGTGSPIPAMGACAEATATIAKAPLEGAQIAEFPNLAAFWCSPGAARAVGTSCDRAASPTRLGKTLGLVWILAAHPLVRTPKGEAVARLVLALLGGARSATPVAWHNFIGGIVPAELVKVLVVHVLSPFLERAKDDILSPTVTSLMPAEWAPADLVRSH